MGRIRKQIRAAAMVGVAGALVAGTVLGTASTAGARTKEPRIAAPAVVPTEPTVVRSAPLTKPLVILYGDSLADEAVDSFIAAFAAQPGVQVITRTAGGTAICDFLGDMRKDAAMLAPGAVVIEFSGNALTNCMKSLDGQRLSGDAYWDRYHTDAQTAIDIFTATGTRVIFAGSPISRAQEANADFNGGKVNSMYAQLADEQDGVEYVDAGAAVLDNGRWTSSLPCLPGEPCTGGVDGVGRAVNLLRSPVNIDGGGHFCPVTKVVKAGVLEPCPVWSSGAYRYATAMAQPVLDALAA
jgi:hypothetical protein